MLYIFYMNFIVFVLRAEGEETRTAARARDLDDLRRVLRPQGPAGKCPGVTEGSPDAISVVPSRVPEPSRVFYFRKVSVCAVSPKPGLTASIQQYGVREYIQIMTSQPKLQKKE